MFWLRISGLIVVAVILLWQHHIIDGSAAASDQSSAIVALTGASSCTQELYWIRLGGSKATIYDCTINGATKCVTFQNGIASDSTAEVKLAFEDALGSTRPTCIS